MKCEVCGKKLVGAVMAQSHDGDEQVGLIYQSRCHDTILCIECSEVLAFVPLSKLHKTAASVQQRVLRDRESPSNVYRRIRAARRSNA